MIIPGEKNVKVINNLRPHLQKLITSLDASFKHLLN